MAVVGAVLSRFDVWSETFDVHNVSRLEKQLVHRHQASNVFVSRVERADGPESDQFIGQFAFDPEHPFFFEHPLDHVPGLMLIEGARQFGIATAHLFYEVPFDTAFILDGVQVAFQRFAELRKPVFALSNVRDKVVRHGQLVGMTFEGDFIQDRETIGSMRAAMKIYDRRLLARLRRGTASCSDQLVG